MKHLFTIPFAIMSTVCVAQNSSAQITINSTDVGHIGKKYEYYTDTSVTNFLPGTGSNQTWDFTIHHQDEYMSNEILDITQYLFGSQYPQADLLLANNMGFAAAMKNDANAFVTLGLIDLNNIGFYRIDQVLPDTVIRYNMNMGSNWTDSSAYMMTMYFGMDPGIGSVADSIRIISMKKDYNIVNGEGSVITEYGSYQALQLMTTSVNTEKTEFYVNGTWIPFGTENSYSQISYNWWAKNLGMMIAYAEQDIYTGNFSVTRLYSITTVTGITESSSKAQLQAWPNPATDILNVHTPESAGEIKIYDMQGKMVKQSAVHSTQTHLNVNDLPAGLYTLVYSVKQDTQLLKLHVLE
ncbi:MAG: hypothetical protein Fur0041_18960 [Bacteroidia bacterium]